MEGIDRMEGQEGQKVREGRRMARSALGVAVHLALWPAGVSGLAAQLPRVSIATDRGTIEVEVDSVHAPRTAGNFLRYVDAQLYDGGSFFRTVTLSNQPNNTIKIEVIQGGMDSARAANEAFPPTSLERTSVTGLKHQDGTISMARGGPDTATHSFFFCINDQPELDFGGRRNPDGQGFAAFGRVTKGMDLVRQIQGLPADGQRITSPVKLLSVRRRQE